MTEKTTPLAYNMAIPQLLKGKYSLGIAIFPMLSSFSFFLLPILIVWLTVDKDNFIHLMQSWDIEPFYFLIVFIIYIKLAILGGYIFGWKINVVIARQIYGWSEEKIESVFLYSKVPEHWYKEGAREQFDRLKQQAKKNWQKTKSKGILRFILPPVTMQGGYGVFIIWLLFYVKNDVNWLKIMAWSLLWTLVFALIYLWIWHHNSKTEEDDRG